MDILTTIKKITAPLQRRIMNMICKGVVKMIDDKRNFQQLQVSLLDGEVATLERWQEYGFTSNPSAGAESLAVFLGGSRDHGLIIKCDDRQYRLKLPDSGSVAVYDKAGNTIILNPSSGKITVNANFNVVVNALSVELGGETMDPTDGCVTGKCNCAAYGVPHPMVSQKVKAKFI